MARWRDSLRRSRRTDASPTTGTAVPAPRGAWASLPPIRRTVSAMPLTIGVEPWRDLSAWRNPAYSHGGLGHLLDPSGPAGLVLSAATSRAVHPETGRVAGAPLPLSRSMQRVDESVDDQFDAVDPEGHADVPEVRSETALSEPTVLSGPRRLAAAATPPLVPATPPTWRPPARPVPTVSRAAFSGRFPRCRSSHVQR